MQWYAVQLDTNGHEHVGGSGKLLFELKTLRGAINRVKASNITGKWRLYTYINFYDRTTFTLFL